jgi:molybdopterin biosynthesis enzyme
MTDKQWEQTMAQLPKGATVVRKYTAFENGETRWVVRLADGRETRYVVHFKGEDVRLEHRP